MKYIVFLSVLGVFILSQGLWAGQVYYTDQACQSEETCATTCTQAMDSATPLPTINDGMGCLAAENGDTLIIREGTYDELIIGNTFVASNLPPGTNLLVPGTSWENPTILKGAAGERVVIQPTQNYPGGGGVITITNPQLRYVIFDNLILDANQTTTNGVRISDASHIRIQQSEVKNALSDGILLAVGDVSSTACCHELIQVDSHHHDVDLPCDPISNELRGHGAYIETPLTLVDGSQFHHNAHHGFQFFSSHPGVSPDDGVLQNSEIFSNALCTKRGGGIVTTASSSRIGMYNNRVYNNSLGITAGSPESKVYNNTVYNNNKNSNNHGIFVKSRDIIVKNNIIIDHRENAILDFGTRTTAETNLCDVATFGCTIVVAVAGVVFTDPQSNDFSLVMDSPAIDAGEPLTEVPTDTAGTPRPQGAAYDVGAFEFVQTSLGPAAPEQLQFVLTP